MIEKTRGIVLHQVKYSDSGIVVQVYTQKYGRLSFMVKGLRNKKTGRHNVFFQPMYILDLVIYYKESREIQILKEFSVHYSPADVQSNIKKSSVAIFLGEVLTSVLKEETPNEELFDYIQEAVVYFDTSKEDFANFHLAFLSGLSSFLGFEPGIRSTDDDIYFDMLNGSFVTLPPVHGHYAGREVSDVLSLFFSSSFSDVNEIALNGALRNEVLEILVNYYALHLPGLKKIRSLEVLKEVFG